MSIPLNFTDKVSKTSDQTLEAKTVIIATGAAPRLLGIPGEQEMYRQRCQPVQPVMELFTKWML